jgi:hypothetical protein
MTCRLTKNVGLFGPTPTLIRVSLWQDPSIDSANDPKEDIKEQPTSRNLSATARRVLLCTVHGQLQLLGNIFQLSVPCTAVNVQNRIE